MSRLRVRVLRQLRLGACVEEVTGWELGVSSIKGTMPGEKPEQSWMDWVGGSQGQIHTTIRESQ